jgi:PAS domain S-box-containing protein
MVWDRTDRPQWLRCTAGVLVAIIAAGIRWHFLEVLELRAPFLTFYPAVAIAWLYGGFSAGLTATVVSAAFADYFWMEPVGQFGIANSADLMSMVVFLASGTLISYLAEATYRAHARAHKAEEQSRLSAERKRAEVLLQRQAELLHLSQDAIIVWQLGGCIESWNKGAEDLYGYSQEEALGRVTHDLLKTIHPEPWPQIEAKLRERKFWEGEVKHHTCEGREVIISARHQLVRGADGVERVLETNRDITESKRAEEALRESEVRFRALVQASSDVVYRMSPNWDQMYHLNGRNFISDTETPSNTWLENYIHPDDQPVVTATINEAIRNRSIFELEHRVLRVDGSLGWTFSRAIPLKDQNGEILEWFGAASNITERKQMEEQLRESEERFRTMANAIPQLAWIAQADGYIYWYNQRWYDYTGTKPEQMEGWGWQSVHNPETLPDVLEQWKNSVATGKPFDMVFPLRGVDGNFRQFLTRVQPVKNAAGEVVQWCGTNTDITERKQMEEELRKSRDELELRVCERTARLNSYMTKLEQSNQALQDFASIASHDMREPLRKVISFGNMLRQKFGDALGQPGNDYLNRMLHATERMQSLLTGLLDYSRVATASEQYKKIDLSDLVDEVLSDLELRIVKTSGEIHVETLPVVSANSTQMRQLFQNLIGNALKFHKPGVKPIVQIRSAPNSDSVCQIIVEDNGIGIEEQHLEGIFAPFHRLHGRSSQYEGTGMGLAICSRIVERHGGSITARSTPGVGTSFIVQLPL